MYGTEEDFREVHVPFRKDLPVGRNLQDHVMVPVGYLVDEISPDSGYTFTEPFVESVSALLEYTFFGTGPLSATTVEDPF